MKSLRNLFILCFFLLRANSSFAQSYVPGNSYLDSTGFIEYLAGNLPVIIAAPHGGYLEPDSIPDCPNCSMFRDAYTQEIARGISETFYEETGCYPHVVINLLHRKKLDANRDLEEAAGGFPISEQAWYAYHEFIDSAKVQVMNNYGRGLYLDLHGHAHDIQRIEIGYLLTKDELQLTDVELNTEEYIQESSIRSLASENIQSLDHADLLRGTSSLGTLLGDKGFPSVSSSASPYPLASEPYFTGGYNTRRHGSKEGGNIDGMQLEFNSSIRFDSDLRAALIEAVSLSTIEYIDAHYNNDFTDNYCNLISHTRENNTSDFIGIFPNPTKNILHLKSELNNIG
ncbi:MAG: hypothetical protein ACI9VN_002816, partial [Patescibacteria group bacterium]